MPKRIFVSIAVSKPEALVELPGAATAARRMGAWAAANGYQVVSIDDSAGPVTVNSIRTMLGTALAQTQPVDRLIVFFAGHGAIKDFNDSFWLLSNWCTDPSEAIHVTQFQRMLRFYSPKQVTIIGDCCRVLHKNFLDVIGSAVLTRPLNANPAHFELDRFFAADAGEESFMIRAEQSNEDFCIFTEVLLDALEGDAPTAFEQLNGERAVTSGSLTLHLTNAVPAAANLHHVAMTPKSEPGYYTDRVYVRFPSPPAGPDPSDPPGARAGLTLPDAMGPGTGPDWMFKNEPKRAVPKVDLLPSSLGLSDQNRLEAEQAERENQAQAFRDDFDPADVPTHFETRCGLAILGARPTSVETSSGRVHRDPNRPDVWFPIDTGGGDVGRDWVNVVVTLEAHLHAYLCAVQGFITTLQVYNADRAAVIHRPAWEDPRDTAAVEILARANAGLLSSEDIVNTAARLRGRKHADFTLGCVAAYLYDSIGDLDSIRSIAAFYAQAGQIIPLDVALLSNGRLSADRGRLFVDIAATQDRAPRTEIEKARRFTFGATGAIDQALVGGSAPWLRSGWAAIATATFDDSASAWRERAQEVVPHLAPAPFTMVREGGRQQLADLVGVRVGELAESY